MPHKIVDHVPNRPQVHPQSLTALTVLDNRGGGRSLQAQVGCARVVDSRSQEQTRDSTAAPHQRHC
jgi:hypothetical protein